MISYNNCFVFGWLSNMNLIGAKDIKCQIKDKMAEVEYDNLSILFGKNIAALKK